MRAAATRSILTLVLVFFLACPALAESPMESAINEGSRYVREKKYAKAAESFEKAVKASPKSAKANLLLGLAYANSGDHDKALEYTLRASELDPSYSTYHNLGLVYANKKEFEKAIDAYRKALAINATSYQTWYQLGQVEAASGDFKSAIDAFKKTIELNPMIANAYLGMASAYFWSGDAASAEKQVGRLREAKFSNEAKKLQEWLKDKKTKMAEKPTPA